MKAYKEQWIYNRSIREQAVRWYQQDLLTDAQLREVRKAYPVEFRQTNGFIEIGLFLFTTVAILACYLLPASVFAVVLENQQAYAIFNIVSGIGVGVVGQLLINGRLLYRNGIDNAFVATLTGFLAFGLNQLLPNGLSTATHCLLTLPLLILILWYYGDTLIAFFTLATFYTFVFDSLLKYSWGKAALPFVMMAVSLVLYWAVTRFVNRNPKHVYYTDPLNLTQWISLIILAAGGNYFVVRELNALLLKGSALTVGPAGSPDIALPWLFWLLTFLIPVIYLWQGLTHKNPQRMLPQWMLPQRRWSQQRVRMLIILGTLGTIAAFATVHEYAALVPLNVGLTIGGLIMIGIAVAGIQYLRQPKHGFTDAPDDDSPNEFFTNAATIAAVHATGTAQPIPKNDLRFGGGDFGGGGSEGKY